MGSGGMEAERKMSVEKVEQYMTGDNSYFHVDPHFDKHTELRLVRRIDYRLLPILGALYAVALIDRNNVAHAYRFLLWSDAC